MKQAQEKAARRDERDLVRGALKLITDATFPVNVQRPSSTQRGVLALGSWNMGR